MERTVIPAPTGSFGRSRRSAGWRSTAPVERPVTVDPPRVELKRLDDRMIEFIGKQEMIFVTAALGGRTARRGPVGFVQVPSRRLVTWPEYGGGAPITGQVRLLLLDLLHERTGLHVTGRASVVSFGPLRVASSTPVVAPGPQPERWVRVRVDQAWFADQGPLV
jgi:hypothetical protein